MNVSPRQAADVLRVAVGFYTRMLAAGTTLYLTAPHDARNGAYHFACGDDSFVATCEAPGLIRVRDSMTGKVIAEEPFGVPTVTLRVIPFL